jgi:hypothetical protein
MWGRATARQARAVRVLYLLDRNGLTYERLGSGTDLKMGGAFTMEPSTYRAIQAVIGDLEPEIFAASFDRTK